MSSSSFLSHSSIFLPSISSRHTRNLTAPLIFDEDYESVTNWYQFHGSNHSTTIHKMELRKEHIAPFHEYIIVFTRDNHPYRIDRGRDGSESVLATVRKQGVPSCDTIVPLQPTVLQELEGTYDCVLELRWGGDKTIDLLLVLNICFQIHSDSGKRYKLLTYNCYFFAQTIIMIAVRKTVSCRTELDRALKHGLCDQTLAATWDAAGEGRSLADALARELGYQLGYKQGLDGWELGWELGRELNRVLDSCVLQQWELEKSVPQKQALGQRMSDRMELLIREEVLAEGVVWMVVFLGVSVPVVFHTLDWALDWRVLDWVLAGGAVGLALIVSTAEVHKMAVNLATGANWVAGWAERRTAGEAERLTAGSLAEWVGAAGRAAQAFVLGCVVGLAVFWLVVLLVDWSAPPEEREQLVQPLEQERLELERLEELRQELQRKLKQMQKPLSLEQARRALVDDLELALSGEPRPDWTTKHGEQDSLATTIPNEFVHMCASWLIESLGKIVIRKVDEAPFLDSSFSGLLEFPASFTVSSKAGTSSEVPLAKYKDLEKYVQGLIERHIGSMPLPAGNRDQLREEILDAMKRTWHLVSLSPCMFENHVNCKVLAM